MKFSCPSFLLMFLILPFTVWPNSAPVYTHGVGAVDIIPIKNRNIRMVREIVSIDCGWTTYTVKVDFWFKNATGQPQQVRLGFPIDYDYYMEDEGKDINDYLHSIKVEWKGQSIKFNAGKPQKMEVEGERTFNRQWITWLTRFAPNEEAHNRVCYTFPTWNMDAGSKGEQPFCYLKYILKTGAAWQGPIESSKVIINYNHSFPEFLGGSGKDSDSTPDPSSLSIYPKGYTWDKDKKTVTWEFKNFVPDKDIYFGWGDVPNFNVIDKENNIRFDDLSSTSTEMKKSGKP